MISKCVLLVLNAMNASSLGAFDNHTKDVTSMMKSKIFCPVSTITLNIFFLNLNFKLKDISIAKIPNAITDVSMMLNLIELIGRSGFMFSLDRLTSIPRMIKPVP